MCICCGRWGPRIGNCCWLRRIQTEHRRHRLGIHLIQQFHEHPERFGLVLHQRILLSVRPEMDTFLQIIHLPQMVLPLLIDDLQDDHLLDLPHHVGAEFLFFPDGRTRLPPS